MSRAGRSLTAQAREGFRCEDPMKSFESNPYLKTSPSWFAYQLGAYLARTGRQEPSDVRMGRGYQIRERDMVFAFDSKYAITRVE